VAEGHFREDLYFRLNVIAVEMPPLRERRDDLIRFADHYAKHFGTQCERKIDGFTDEAMACLSAYPWPGNLREMRNAMERAVILARKEKISPEVFPAEMRLDRIAAVNSDGAVGSLTSLDKLEEMHIRKVLDRVPNLGEAAQVLGIDQATLYRKRKKLGLE